MILLFRCSTIFKGWRYIWYGNGALVFVCSILRVTVIRLKETPKYLLTKGNDAAVVEIFHSIAQKYNRPCSLTLEALQSLGTIHSTYGKSRYSFSEFWAHIRGLFVTRKFAISTLMIWLSWTLIGTIAAPCCKIEVISKTQCLSRFGLSTLLCLLAGLSGLTRCSNWTVGTLLPVEKLHAQQYRWNFRACGCGIHV